MSMPISIEDKLRKINNKSLEQIYLLEKSGCTSDISSIDIEVVINLIYDLIGYNENIKELIEENKILKNIIIEKEKELYDK